MLLTQRQKPEIAHLILLDLNSVIAMRKYYESPDFTFTSIILLLPF
jgi:hypothetical protein